MWPTAGIDSAANAQCIQPRRFADEDVQRQRRRPSVVNAEDGDCQVRIFPEHLHSYQDFVVTDFLYAGLWSLTSFTSITRSLRMDP